MAHYYRTKKRSRFYYADLHATYLRSKVAPSRDAASPDTGVQHRTLGVLDEPLEDGLGTIQGRDNNDDSVFRGVHYGKVLGVEK